MNTKRILFWAGFVVILALIVWGLIASGNKTTKSIVEEPAKITSEDHVVGPENAQVTIIEYSDFQCPACRAYQSVIDKLLAESKVASAGTSTGTSSVPSIRLVYRHFPLPQHANGRAAAKASEAASIQGKFWDMHDVLFEKQLEWSEASSTEARAFFVKYARDLGLNISKFESDMDSQTVEDIIKKHEAESERIKITYTPSFFVNNELIDNPPSYEAFKQIIQSAASNSTP